jgi:vWA-MoxR associated protein C-terminal domain
VSPNGRAPGAASPAPWSPSDYLIIGLRPLLDSAPGSDALLSHWRRVHPGEQLKGADRRIDLREAESAVRTLIRQAESEWAYLLTNDLALEFVLPRDLLDLRVERWHKAPFQGVDGVLGEDHQVVVRSLDRLNRRDLHGGWVRRWDAFAQGRAGRVHWFPEDGRPHLLSDPPPAVVVLSAPPSPRAVRRARGSVDELAEALRVGVPVVLWDRRGEDDQAFREALRSLLNRHDPRELPSVVRALRIASGDRDPEGKTEEDFIVGRHVALLWDDPNRMPVALARTPPVPPATEEEGP